MLRRVRANGGDTLGRSVHRYWIPVPSAIARNFRITFALPAALMLAVRSLRLRARKRKLAKGELLYAQDSGL